MTSSAETEPTSSAFGSDPDYITSTRAGGFVKDPDATSTESEGTPLIPKHAKRK